MSRIFIHVQYLKGIGHLQRMRLITEAAASVGLDVHIVTGGLPISGFAPVGVQLHQLPPLQAGPEGFTDLRDERGQRVDEAWRSDRRDRLLALFDELAPDLLLIESFPFGRRQFSFELMPLLEAAHSSSPRPAIVCSVRDILQAARKPGRAEETVSRLRSFFDAVLVHGDPGFAALGETFSGSSEIEDLVHYTGFIAAPRKTFAVQPGTPREEVVVSMGGGAIGPVLLDAALKARSLSALADTPWRLITGPHMPESDFARLQASGQTGVTVERFRNDFRSLVAAAKLSISYAGYNTVTDLMRADVPAVLVTYSGETGGETEQETRAIRLEKCGMAATLPDKEISPEILVRAIETALALPRPKKHGFDLEGARKTADLLLRWSAQASTPMVQE